MRKKPELMKL